MLSGVRIVIFSMNVKLLPSQWFAAGRENAACMWEFTKTDYDLMRLALAEAAGAGAEDEVPAGAVVAAPDGRVAGRGRNRVIGLNDPTAHAEILAIREAAASAGNYRLTGFTLYSTLEPCPMCLMAAIHARLGRIFFGAPEPRWGAAGSLVELASLPGLNHRPEIAGGLMAGECGALIKDFFKGKRERARSAAMPPPINLMARKCAGNQQSEEEKQ